ncbi:hypothetical protein VNO78_27925 [Psophocarpus tetragonolobus]|uniref:Uncharacterized protein n=1 Tax=Psophocarpus tetragonolobus TaxID=3891 RepID=A0AAN9XB57_PSOTE
MSTNSVVVARSGSYRKKNHGKTMQEGNSSADLLTKSGINQVDEPKVWQVSPTFMSSALLVNGVGITLWR